MYKNSTDILLLVKRWTGLIIVLSQTICSPIQKSTGTSPSWSFVYIMKIPQTKRKYAQRCLSDRSNGLESCGAVLNTATSSLAPRQQVHYLEKSRNINRRRFHQQKQTGKQLQSQTTTHHSAPQILSKSRIWHHNFVLCTAKLSKFLLSSVAIWSIIL